MWRVHSANLTQVLRLDPRAVVVPLEHDHLQITLIDPARPLDDLIPVGLTNRPELASHQALVQAVAARIRRERGRILLPSILINGFQTPDELIQAGIFGMGPNNKLNQWAGRDDLSYQVMWELEAFGIGNLARIKEQRGEQSRAIIELFKTQDMVAADVTRAQARLQSAAARVSQADRALRSSLIAFNGNYEGLQQTTRFGDVLVEVFRPQEVVYALQRLKTALDEYFTTVAEYNRAQFEVFHALGYPAREIASIHPPGDIQPVDTARPSYLPPVGNGPPPATR
jgi:outer membrane protein TolC